MDGLDEGLDEGLGALRARLARRAEDAGLLDVAYRTVDSPVGPLLLAATARGVVRVAFAREDHDAVLSALAAGLSPRVLHAPARLEGAARELGEYFEGRRRRFGVPLDLSLVRGFRREVLGVLRGLGYGETASYARVAALAGSPRAVRAVGTACARNPLPLLVPCHRVVRTDGAAGGYLGGPAAKRLLLALEVGTAPGTARLDAGGRARQAGAVSGTSAEDFQPEPAPGPEDVEAVQEAAERERLRAEGERPEPSDADDREEPVPSADPDVDAPG